MYISEKMRRRSMNKPLQQMRHRHCTSMRRSMMNKPLQQMLRHRHKLAAIAKHV